MKEQYTWHKQAMADRCEIVKCEPYNPIDDFTMDTTGYYVLIRPNLESQKIEVAICDQEHRIIKVFVGSNAQELYHTIFQYEKKNDIEYFKDKEHIAYLGKEFKKCELALTVPNAIYYQE